MSNQQALPTKYRLGVGIMLINHDKKVFVGQRADRFSDAWQMPQGGIDEGEEPLAAALRELQEEVGTSSVDVIASTEDWVSYDLPIEIIHELWNGQYRGQKQIWYLMRLKGGNEQINIATEVPEFIQWKWVELEILPEVIVEFKKELYQKLVEYFKPMIANL
jgi:putative (di)nucleoside polyphosphate hydrolase